MSILLKKLVLLLHLQITLCQGWYIFPWGRAHVRVMNQLGPKSSLTLHCQSKDDDLGVHVLLFQQFFEWDFRPNVPTPSTLFFCKIQWETKVMMFDSYRETRDLYNCHKFCYWDVTPQGPCMLKAGGGYDFCYYWPKAATDEAIKGMPWWSSRTTPSLIQNEKKKKILLSWFQSSCWSRPMHVPLIAYEKGIKYDEFGIQETCIFVDSFEYWFVSSIFISLNLQKFMLVL